MIPPPPRSTLFPYTSRFQTPDVPFKASFADDLVRQQYERETARGQLFAARWADDVAEMMQDIIEEVGGDGFLIFNGTFDRRYIVEVCDGLVPELQRRGLTRTGYPHKLFKDNLLEF